MFKLFKRKVTASECGKLGAAVKRIRHRNAVRERCDQMRAAAGLPKAEWPE